MQIMNQKMVILPRLMASGLMAGALLSFLTWTAPISGVQQTDVPKLEFRRLADADDKADKPIIDAWKAALADAKNKGKVDQAAATGVSPSLFDSKEPAGRYQLVPVTKDQLSQLGIRLGSTFKKDAETQELIDKAREKRELLVIPGRNLVFYSWSGRDAESLGYAVLARPVDDEASIGGKEIQMATPVADAHNLFGVHVRLNKSGAEKLKTFSEKNQKRYLIVSLGGEVVLAARISEPVTTGELEISNRMTAAQAREIAERIGKMIIIVKAAKDKETDKTEIKELEKEKDKSREKSAAQDKEKDKGKSTDKEKDKGKSIEEAKGKDAAKDKGKDREKDKGKGTDKDETKDKGGDKEKDKGKSTDKDENRGQ
jgi:hypothetical protein